MKNSIMQSPRVVSLALIMLLALAVRVYWSAHRGVWTRDLVPVHGEANITAVYLAAGAGYATPFLHATNLPARYQALLPQMSPMGHPILVVATPLPPSAHAPPGYPVWLAGLIRLAGGLGLGANTPYRLALVAGILLSVASVVALAWVAGEHWGPIGIWCAGIPLCLWPPLVRISVSLWNTPYTLAGMSLCLVFVSLWKKQTGLWWFAAFGVLAGLLTQFNPATGPMLGTALVAGIWGRLPTVSRGRAAAVAVGVWLICLAPWLTRNLLVFGRFIPVRNNFGLELWLGTLPECDGGTGSVMGRHPMEVRSEQELLAAVGEDRYQQQRWRDAVHAIRLDGPRFLQRTAQRVQLYWFGYLSNVLPGEVHNWSSCPVVDLLMRLFELVRISGAFIGLFLYRDRPTKWVLLAAVITLPAPYYLTHVGQGYRILVEPFVWLMVTGTIVRLLQRPSPLSVPAMENPREP